MQRIWKLVCSYIPSPTAQAFIDRAGVAGPFSTMGATGRSDVKDALRKLYKLVHPDLFNAHQAAKASNSPYTVPMGPCMHDIFTPGTVYHSVWQSSIRSFHPLLSSLHLTLFCAGPRF